jgi:uncharacterized protein (TIGR03437 family)
VKILLPLVLAAAASAQQQFNLAIPIRAVAQDSATPVPITWISTEGGIFRSSDTSLDWRNVYVRPAGQAQPIVRFIHIAPDNPKVIYLVSNLDSGGVWKSDDGGATWKQMNSGLPADGVIDAFIALPATPLTIYAKVDNQVYKTTDGAATWTLRSRLPLDTTVFQVNRATPALMYAVVKNAIYRSVDEGVNWIFETLDARATITSLLVDPSDPNVVHLTAAGPRDTRAGFYRSVNGDRFVASVPVNLDGFAPTRLVSDKTGRAVYAGADEDGVIYRTDDKGLTWFRLVGLPGAGFTTLALDPNDPRIVLAGTAVGLFGSDNSGAVWRSRRGAAKPTLSLPPFPLDFTLPADSQGRLQMLLRVIETSQWTLPVSATAEGAAWLKLEGAAINTPATPLVTVDTHGLERGEYQGIVRVEAPSSANAPVSVPVKLTIVAPRPVSQSYRISTIAGTGQRGNFGDGQPAVRAFFGDLDSMAVDRDGNIYVSDPSSSVVRRIGTDGVITRYAGNGRRGDSGDNASALLAQLDSPTGLAVDAAGTLYICDTGSAKIRKVTPDGTITTLASGVGPCRGVAVDSAGFVYWTVPAAHVVLRVDAAGKGSIYAGTIGLGGFRGDGGAPGGALLSGPLDVFVDSKDRLYIADTGNNRIRRVAAGVITTVAGSGAFGYQGEGSDATKFALGSPGGIAADNAGNLYIADAENHRIRMVKPDGSIRTLAGMGVRGFTGDNGLAANARIAGPMDIAVEPNGNVLSAEPANLRIRRLVPPPPPVLPVVTEGPVNWADGSSRLAPGTLFLLRGTGLAVDTLARGDAPWPLDLGGAQVTFNGQPVPLASVSPTEITGMIPYNAAPGAGTLVVSRDEAPSQEVTVTLEPTAPALLLNGPGRALAANENGSANSADEPAAPESLLTLFLTGSGLTENPPAGGAGAGEESKPLLPVTVQFGELTVEPLVARLSPGRVGVMEVQFRVPVNEQGDYSVAVHIGDGLSGTAIVSVGPLP